MSALLSIAYGLQGYQISGGPRWMYSDRYDVVGKADGNPNRDQFSAMLQTLLEDRFKLTSHRETRELPVYVLVVGKDGPKLKKSSEDQQYSLRGTDGTWIVSHLGMAGLATRLSRELGQTVVDQTGLPGTFDFTLEWSQDLASPLAGDSAPASQAGRPSIFTAVQEQLGLKLESRKHAVDMLIVDNAEGPAEN